MIKDIAKDILDYSYKVKLGDSYSKNIKSFYEIMRKHGIKRGIKNENGSITVNTPEWTMCFEFFNICVQKRLEILTLFTSKMPEDLRHY